MGAVVEDLLLEQLDGAAHGAGFDQHRSEDGLLHLHGLRRHAVEALALRLPFAAVGRLGHARPLGSTPSYWRRTHLTSSQVGRLYRSLRSSAAGW